MRILLFAFAALAMVASPAAGQQVETVQFSADPYERIYDALIAGSDDEPTIEAALDWMVAELRRDENIAFLEATYPDLLKRMRKAARPIIMRYSERVKLAYRPRMVALLRADLTPDEAAEIADFYASPIGRRLVAGVTQSYRPDAVLDTVLTDEQVTQADVERDLSNATAATLAGLSAEESRELFAAIAERPAMAKLAPVVPRITALRAEMEEEPMTAEEEGAIESAFLEIFDSLEDPKRDKRK